MSILSIAEAKSRFSTKDKPSGKDFNDLIDTVIGNIPSDAHINTLIATAVSAITAGSTPVITAVNPPSLIAGANSLWFQTKDGSGNSVSRMYWLLADNLWHSKHPIPSGTIMFCNDLTKLGIPGIDNTSISTAVMAALATFDGGGTPGTGAMWEIASELQGSFPLGVHPVNFTLADQTGGEATHLLTVNEMPAHHHNVALKGLMRQTDPGDDDTSSGLDTSGSGSQPDIRNSPVTNPMATVGGGVAHNNMPPYCTGYFLRRTTRTDYVVTPGT